MPHYVLVDGHLQLSSPETERWLRRATKAVPQVDREPEADAVALKDTPRSIWEVIEGIDETE